MVTFSILAYYLLKYSLKCAPAGTESAHFSTYLFVNFISLITSCVGPQGEEPQTAQPMSCTWASHTADVVHYMT